MPPERTDQSPLRWRAFAWVVLALGVVYLPLAWGQIVFFRDIAHWTFPARAFVRDSLLRGEAPTWNPFQALGFAALSDPLYGVFYPPNWLFMLVGSSRVASLLSWLDFAHLVWGSAGMFWLARRLRGTAVSAGVAALAWALSGYTTSQWSAGIRLLAAAWIPWAALGHLALLDDWRVRGRVWGMGLVRAALPTALGLLMGEVFLAMMGVGFALALLIIVALCERRYDPSLSRVRPRWAAALVSAWLLAAGLGAVAVVPARALMASNQRAAPLSRSEAEIFSMHPLRLIEFAAPGSMGDAYGEYPASRWVGEASTDGLPLSYSMYMGASVLALALLSWRRDRPLVLALVGLCTCALLLAMGRYLPVHALFRRVVFPFSFMRSPEKYMTIFMPAFALLAGEGCRHLFSGEGLAWRRTGVLLGLLVGLGIAAPFVFPFPWSGYMVHGLGNGALAVLGIMGIQILAARRSRWAPRLLFVVVTADLGAACWSLQNFVPAGLANQQPPAVQAILADHAGKLAPARVFRSEMVTNTVMKWTQASNQTEGEARLMRTLVPNTANLWGVAMVPGYDAALPSLFTQAWNAGQADRLQALRLAGVEYAILPVRDPHQVVERPGLDPMFDPLPGARLYRVTRTLPRVFLARHAEALSDDQAQARLYEPDVVAGHTAWLAPDAQAGVLVGAPGSAGDCQLRSFSNRSLTAHCRAELPGLAVFNEQFDRGWSATVDGVVAPILRANLFMRALRLSPGDHEIVMRHRSPGLRGGAWISLLSLAGLLALVIVHKRRG
jgi:hypothetical protein